MLLAACCGAYWVRLGFGLGSSAGTKIWVSSLPVWMEGVLSLAALLYGVHVFLREGFRFLYILADLSSLVCCTFWSLYMRSCLPRTEVYTYTEPLSSG